MSKTIINVFNLIEMLNGRKWEDLSEEEQLEISKKIADKIFKKYDYQKY